ncbi:MAG: type I restriction endonuclease subunit M, partial [Candidatus Omnitrophica bacterium CG23_combo_of_CG06-09_8_20_14_all_41_10]
MNKNIQKPIEEYLKKNSQKVVDFSARDKKVKYNSNIKSHREIKSISGDEEAVRGYLVAKLVNELGYKKENIELEKEYD